MASVVIHAFENLTRLIGRSPSGPKTSIFHTFQDSTELTSGKISFRFFDRTPSEFELFEFSFAFSSNTFKNENENECVNKVFNDFASSRTNRIEPERKLITY